MKVWKYKLHKLGINELELPKGARIVSAGLDLGDFLCIWVEVDPAAGNTTTTVDVLYTGDNVTPGYRFLATVVGSLVYHIYIPTT